MPDRRNAFHRPRAKPNKRKRMSLRARLIKRDGDGCFYCGDPLERILPTIEHLLSRAHSGPNCLENLALACKPCNDEADNLSVVEKVKLRERKRQKRAPTPVPIMFHLLEGNSNDE